MSNSNPVGSSITTQASSSSFQFILPGDPNVLNSLDLIFPDGSMRKTTSIVTVVLKSNGSTLKTISAT